MAPGSSLVEAAKAELARIAANGDASKVDEVYRICRRVIGVAGVMPFVGPWLIRGSPFHTETERNGITVVSIVFSLALVILVWTLLPGESDRILAMHQRVASQTAQLRTLVDDYRRQHGDYPDAQTWKRSAEQADPRFYDPWGRIYLLRQEREGYALGTLGRDAAEGGSGEDADAWTSFPSPVGQGESSAEAR